MMEANTENSKKLPKRVNRFMLAASALSIGLITLVSLPLKANIPLQSFSLPLPEVQQQLDDTFAMLYDDFEAEDSNIKWVEVQKGDTFGVIMEREGISNSLALELANNPKGKRFNNLSVGKHLELKFDDNNELVALNYHFSNISILSAERTDDGFAIQEIVKPIESQITSYGGVIDSSLFLAGQSVGMQAQQIMDMADAFAWDIDFGRQVRAGNQFSAVFDVPYADGEAVGSGKLLAARLVIGDKTYTAFYDKKNDAYYDADGKSLKKGFLRNPVDYVRITSHFKKGRFHPILQKTRDHKGVDYGAPTGTPIKATADGKVAMRGWGNGYGNMVTLQHGKKYTTVYAHMSKFAKNLHVGKTVKQGEVIGYVGMTGYATGPHLHYEFRIDGKHVDPLSIKMIEGEGLSKKDKPAFLATVAQLTERMDTPVLNENVMAKHESATENQQQAQAYDTYFE